MAPGDKYTTAKSSFYGTPYQVRDVLARLISGENPDGSTYSPPLIANSPSKPLVGTPVTVVKATGVAATDTAAVQAALNAGDVLLATDGPDFKLGYLTYEGTSSRSITALGAVKIIQTDQRGVFSLRGAWDSLGTVSSIAGTSSVDLVYPGESNPGSTRTTAAVLTMATAQTVARDDVVKIVSDDDNPWGRPTQGGGLNNRMGEYGVVGIASTGVTISLSNVLIESYVTAIRLARLRDVTFVISGPITFDTDPAIRDNSVFGAVIELRACKYSFIGNGVRIQNSIGRAIGNYGYCTEIDGVEFRNLANRPSKSQYGYGVQDGGWQLRMTNCHGERLRHMYAEGANTVSAGSTNYEYFGGGFFASVNDCTAMNCEGQAFDTHGTSYGVTFSDCKVYGSFQGASSGGAGFVSRGRYTTFRDCYTDGSFRGFSFGGWGTRAIDCTALRCRYSALEFGVDLADSTQQTAQGNYEVVGGLYETVAASRVFSLSPSAGYTVTGKLNKVKFRPVAALNGLKVMECGVSAAAANVAGNKLVFEDVDVDLKDAGAVNVIIVDAESDNIIVRGKRLNIDHNGSAVTAATIINGAGAAAGFGADVQVEHYVWDSTNVNPVNVGASQTATMYSGRAKVNVGSSWFHFTKTNDQTIASAAAAVLPIARLLDDEVLVRVTGGSATSVTFAAIPATPRQNGMRLVVSNRSTDTITVGGVAIAPNAAARYAYSGGTWIAV